MKRQSTRTKGRPGFGPNLKAARLSYRWSDRHGAFIRISETEAGFVVELAPAHAIPNKSAVRGRSRLFFCWWEGEEILDSIVPLRLVRRCKRAFHFIVNEEGELL